jgi:hypothetical protein
MKRKRLEAERSMGPGLAPHYSSTTKLAFDRNERELVQAFVFSGRRGPLAPLGQGLLASSDDGSSLGGSLDESATGHESRAWSRWGNSSHGTTAVVVADLVKLGNKAAKVNRELVDALSGAGLHTTALAIATAAAFAVPSVAAKVAGKGARHRIGHGGSETPSNPLACSTVPNSRGSDEGPHSARSVGSGYSSLTNASLKQTKGHPIGGVALCGSGARGGNDEDDDDDALGPLISGVRAGGAPSAEAQASKRRDEKAARKVAGDAWLQTLAGTPWDPQVAVCARGGCQGCAYHALKATTSADEPGPATYALPDLTTQVPGGRFNGSKAKTALDWVEYYEKQKVREKRALAKPSSRENNFSPWRVCFFVFYLS